MRLSLFSLAALSLLTSSSIYAAAKNVDSLAALQAAINESAPGDTITLKDGVYTTAQAIAINRAGTAEQPITIASETVGGVEINGTNGFSVTTPAAYVVVSGFKFTHASGTSLIDEGTSQIRFSRNTFLCTGDGPYLSVSGDDVQIDYNEFGAKKSAGNMIAVAGTGSQVARRLWIHHNYLHDLTNSGGEGAQMIRMGLMSAHGQSIGGALVEHNLFANCRGVSETISSRSSGNTYRYNTLIDSPTSQLTLRQGNDCMVYGNYFRNTEGVRIFGDRHQVVSNYFEANHIAINLGNGAPDPTDGTPNKNERPDDCVIAFNTFIENRTAYTMTKRSPEALGATNTNFSNNIIVGGGTAVRIAGPYSGAIWGGNILWNIKNGDLPAEGFTTVDPVFAGEPEAIKRFAGGSPAIEAATGAFPGVAFDMDGQPRPEKKTVGADEISTAPVSAHFLTVADVGPAASEVKADEPAATTPPATPPSASEPAKEKPAPETAPAAKSAA